MVHRNRLWKFRGEQEDLWKYEDQPSTGTGGVEEEDSTLRRSKRKRTPRVVLDL